MRGVLLYLIAIFAMSLPAMCDEFSLSVEQFPFKSTGSISGDGAWEMSRNGYMGTFITVPKACRVTFCVRGAGSGAVMHVHVGSSKFVHTVNATDYHDYRSACQLPAGTHAVRVELTNLKPGQESKLQVKQMLVSGTGVKLADTKDMDALALKAADSYIENYRKGSFEITVVSSNGKPLPAGKQVHIKLRKHAFDFGTALYGTNTQNGDWLRENPDPASDAYKYQEFVKTHFNMIVPENAGKWGACEGARDVETMEFIDAMLAFAKKNGMKARMHCVLWGQNPPKWVEDLIKTAIDGPSDEVRNAAKAELREEITERIDCLVKQRTGSYVELDGINESMHQDAFLKIYGPAGVAGIYDEIINASNGRARVYFNEFNLFQWVRAFGFNDGYCNWYKEHMQQIINSGISPANRTKIGIGMQYYPGDDENARKNSPHSPARISQILHSFAGLEYPMTLTEFATDEKNKASAPRLMADTMRMVFGNDQTTGFLVWGFWRKHMWLTGSAMVDDNWNLTDCGKTYEQLLGIRDWGIKDLPVWTTDLNLKTAKDGKVSFRGFYGEYEVTVDGKTRRVTVGPKVTKVRV